MAGDVSDKYQAQIASISHQNVRSQDSHCNECDFEARHPRCVGSKKNCVLQLQSNTTIFHLVVH